MNLKNKSTLILSDESHDISNIIDTILSYIRKTIAFHGMIVNPFVGCRYDYPSIFVHHSMDNDVEKMYDNICYRHDVLSNKHKCSDSFLFMENAMSNEFFLKKIILTQRFNNVTCVYHDERHFTRDTGPLSPEIRSNSNNYIITYSDDESQIEYWYERYGNILPNYDSFKNIISALRNSFLFIDNKNKTYEIINCRDLEVEDKFVVEYDKLCKYSKIIKN